MIRISCQDFLENQPRRNEGREERAEENLRAPRFFVVDSYSFIVIPSTPI
jgi:hypothetical protein